jgi:BioD-like phosphotransacetylase family protein
MHTKLFGSWAEVEAANTADNNNQDHHQLEVQVLTLTVPADEMQFEAEAFRQFTESLSKDSFYRYSH